jgi:RimJ/RimL family protein N-acetyltransferase
LLVWDSSVWRPSTLPEAGETAEIELGWTLLHDYWGHGYATEAAEAVREAAWADLELERLISIIHPDNARSIRVAERLGATPAETIETGGIGPVVVWVHPR